MKDTDIQYIYSVTRVPSTYQRRPENGGESPAPNHHGLIAPSWIGIGDGYKSRSTAHTGEQCLQKISLTHVCLLSSQRAVCVERLRRVLLELRRAGLSANPRKCHLALPEAKYLGFQVGRGLIKPQEKKVAAILSAPRPTSKTQVRAFLGLAGYYRCFISNFSSLAAPLTDLTKKGQPEKVPWGPTEEEALRRVKASLTSEPVLRAPDFNCPFLLQTDASDTGLGAVLSQIQDGEEHPVIYINRKLTPAEQRYAAVEKEALAVKWAVLELRYYLLGRKFTLITDHAPLQWMARAKDTNARVTRWFLALQDFHFTLRHRAGTANANADGLSRIWAAFAGLSGFTPSPISPLSRGARTTLRGGGGVWRVSRVPISVALETEENHLQPIITGWSLPAEAA